MSKSNKLKRILASKGWDVDVWWEPVRNVLWGCEGGYCLDIKNYNSAQLSRLHCFWLGYDFESALEEANKYPICKAN